MLQQRITNPRPDVRPPWSPVAVSLLSLLLPAGGAILTVRNLQLMRQLDPPLTRRLSIAIIVAFALGLSALILLGHPSHGGVPQVDSTSLSILAWGTGLSSYIVQYRPFRSWRGAHARQRVGNWLVALGFAVLYQIVAVVLATPLVVAALLIGASAGIVIRP